jgi:hypothetical protein
LLAPVRARACRCSRPSVCARHRPQLPMLAVRGGGEGEEEEEEEGEWEWAASSSPAPICLYASPSAAVRARR